MKLLCDENIPIDISNNLSSKHKVINVSQKFQGITDEEVYNIAYKNKMCIITSDHHFDRYKNRKHFGIIRIIGNLKDANKLINKVLSEYKKNMENTYIKISNEGYKVDINKHSKLKRKLRKQEYKFLDSK